MNNPLLSVIIPVFNCAPVITRCLESIDYPDSEIIVIDDGSTDTSVEMVQRYAQNHSNVILICKDNGGVSSARNVGLDLARGKYIMFVDADDYIARNGLEQVLGLAESYHAEIVKYGVRYKNNESELNDETVADFPIEKELITGKAAVLHRFDIFDCYVWDSIILRQLIDDHAFRFHADLSLHEDDVFMGSILSVATVVLNTNLPLYRYSIASNYSSTHNQSIAKQRDLINSSIKAVKYRKEQIAKNCPEVSSLERMKYMRYVCMPNRAYAAKYTISEYRAILNQFRELDCYPLSYKWMHVARLDGKFINKLKLSIKTFLCNHPLLAYKFLEFRSALK